MLALRPGSLAAIAVRLAVVALTLGTGWIHLTLGGTLFTLNGLGYLVAAVAMILPVPVAIRFRWLVRLGLIGYALVAIIGWYLMGPRWIVAYAAKAIEIALIALLAIEMRSFDGNPLARLRRPTTPVVRA